MIHLYLQKNDRPILDLGPYISQLPENIQSRIMRRKQKNKRETSLRGYLLLQQALQKDFGINLDQITFLKSGKPIFIGEDIFFNISHSGDLIGVAISNEGAIGLDIEKFRHFEKVEISFSFFSAVEQQAILKAKIPQRKLIEFWSKKEALVKAVGGRMFDMAAFTDVRFSRTQWENSNFYFYAIKQDFDGYIWIASSFSEQKIATKFLDII